jgi:nucleoid DNA-binding protein
MAGKAATKSEIIKSLADSTGLTKKQVVGFFDELTKLVGKNLSKKGPEVFTIPGLVKLVVRVKPAQPAGERMNPFTKQMQFVKAKPASRQVRARPVKALKDLVK